MHSVDSEEFFQALAARARLYCLSCRATTAFRYTRQWAEYREMWCKAKCENCGHEMPWLNATFKSHEL